jgi:thiamine kinase-like enzyme
MDPAAGVVRVGDTVRRPTSSSSDAIRALLLHLEQVGFEGAPRYLGPDEQGRQVMSYIEGEVPLPPYPAWAMTDTALTDLGRLLRRLHEATASFGLTEIGGWSREWADPLGGPVICHNDVFPENVVFRDGRVVALIDFAMAAPGRAFWDVAIAAQEWAPLYAPATRLHHSPDLDSLARLKLLATAYGVGADEAAELVDVIFAERAQSIGHVRDEIAGGNPVWSGFWQQTRGEERAAADDAWLAQHRLAMAEAIASGARGRR